MAGLSPSFVGGTIEPGREMGRDFALTDPIPGFDVEAFFVSGPDQGLDAAQSMIRALSGYGGKA